MTFKDSQIIRSKTDAFYSLSAAVQQWKTSLHFLAPISSPDKGTTSSHFSYLNLWIKKPWCTLNNSLAERVVLLLSAWVEKRRRNAVNVKIIFNYTKTMESGKKRMKWSKNSSHTLTDEGKVKFIITNFMKCYLLHCLLKQMRRISLKRITLVSCKNIKDCSYLFSK